MKSLKHLLLLCTICFFGATNIQAQTNFTLNGATFTIGSNTTLTITGSVFFLNGGAFDNSGVIKLSGDWTNDGGTTGLINSSPGQVIFEGDTQSIKGTDETYFYNMSLTGTGVKQLKVNSRVENTLALTDRELATDTSTMLITNTATNAVTRTSGFVSSNVNGSLEWNTASTGTYQFPVGSSQGTLRYRPVDIVPASSASNSYSVRMANVDATTEGFDITQTDNSVCALNNKFYHRINRTSGTDAADISVYFDNPVDGNFQALLHWQVVPQWQTMAPISLTLNTSPTLSVATKSAWNDFSYDAFILGGDLPSPSVSVSGGTSICAGDTVTLDAGSGYASYSWSTFENTQSIKVTSNGTYSVTVTDANGCTSTDTGTAIVVNSNPTVSVTPSGSTTFCQGDSVVLDAGSGFSSYSWSGGLGTNQTAVANTSGTYTVTVADGNGCTASDAGTTVVSNTNPTVNVTPNGPTTFCQGGSVTLVAGGGFSTYSWSGGLGSNQTAVATAGGTYTVTVTDANGCSAVDGGTTITVNATPSVTVTPSGPTSFCQGGSVTLDAGSGFNNYSWSGGLGSNQTAIANTSGTYTVTVTDGNGCTASDAGTTVTSNTNPTVTVTPSGSTTFCQGGSVTLDAGSGFTTYNWSGGLGSNQTAVASASGTYIVTVTDANGCTASDAGTTVTTNTNPTVTVTPSGSTTFCQGGSVTLDAGSGFTTYSWSGGLGSNQTAVATSSGTYTVTVTDGNGCTAADAGTTVSTNSAPAVTVTPNGPTTFCQGGSVTLDAGNGFTTYSWSGGLGSNQTATAGANGTYTVTVSDANGCTASSSGTTVTVNATPSPSVTPQGPTNFCTGGSVVLTAGAGYTTYAWSNGPNTQSITVNNTGTFTVTVTDANGCSGTSSPVNTTLNPSPTPGIYANGPTNFCSGNNVVLSTDGGYTSYLWSSGLTTQSITVATSGNYSVTVTDANGCTAVSADSAVQVSTISAPTVVASGGTTFCSGGSVSLSTNPNTYTSYQWNNGSTNPTINVAATGNYAVTVTNSNGCTAVGQNVVPVTVNPDPVANFGYTGGNPSNSVSFVDSSTNANTYAWDFGDGGTSSNANPSHNFATGSYTVCLTVTNNCGTDQYCMEIEAGPVGIAELTLAQHIKVYPNPANSTLYVEYDLVGYGDEVKANFYDVLGKSFNDFVLLQGSAGKLSLSLDNYAKGVYFLRLESTSVSYTEKVVITE